MRWPHAQRLCVDESSRAVTRRLGVTASRRWRRLCVTIQAWARAAGRTVKSAQRRPNGRDWWRSEGRDYAAESGAGQTRAGGPPTIDGNKRLPVSATPRRAGPDGSSGSPRVTRPWCLRRSARRSGGDSRRTWRVGAAKIQKHFTAVQHQPRRARPGSVANG